MPICAAMSSIGSNVACRAISMAGGRGTGRDHARRTGRHARRDVSQDALNRPTLKGVRSGETGAWAHPWASERSVAMSKADGVFIYIGTYASEVDARADYDVVKDLHAVGAVGTYDAAVITKDESGKVHVNKDETTTRHGAWGGAGGRRLGRDPLSAFDHRDGRRGRGHRRRQRPPLEGHVAGRRQGIRGSIIDAGEAALVIIGETKIEAYLEKLELKADEAGDQGTRSRQEGKIDEAVQQAAKEVS